MPEPKTEVQPPDQDDKLEERINEIVNRALTARDKRQQTALEKSIADAVAKAIPKPAPAPEPADGDDKAKGSGKVDPQVRLALERVTKLEEQLAAEKKVREAVEARAREDRTRSDLRTALKTVGVKDEAIEIAVGHIIDSRRLVKFDDEGRPILTVSRVRSKGSQAEALEFNDLVDGAKDWAKTPEAAFFLPAPAGGTQTGARRPTPAGVPTRQATPTGRPMTEDEAVRRVTEDLQRKGIDLGAALANE